MLISVILQLLLLISLLWGCKIATGTSNFMDRNYTSAIKWGCCMIVMFSHFNIPEKFHIMGSLHFVCVTLFFLFSGYGLMYQHYNTGGGLSISGIVFKLAIPYFAVIIIKTVFSIPIGNGGMYYMNVITIFYIMFLAISVVTKSATQFLVLMTIFNVAYALVSQFYIEQVTGFFGWGSQSLGFLWGVLLYRYKEQIYNFLKKRTLMIVSILIVISALAGKRYIRQRNIFNVSNEEFFLRIILSFCLICILFSLSTHFIIGNRFSVFMGKRCMYIFLLHGVAIGITDNICDIADPGIYMLLIVMFTLIMSLVADFMTKCMQRFGKKNGICT